MRMEIDDVDIKADSAIIRERKKNKDQRTTRRVQISAFLATGALTEPILNHRLQMMFC